MASDKFAGNEEDQQTPTFARDPLLQMLEEIAIRSKDTPANKKMRKELEDRISAFNASLVYNRQTQKPYITERPVGNIAAWTSPNAPFPTTIGMTPRGPGQDVELADTVSHDLTHHERLTSGAMDKKIGDYVLGQIGNPDTHVAYGLLRKMLNQKTYPTAENVGDSLEEVIANLAGIEGRLPKGVPLTATKEFGDMTQREKDFFFSATSGPTGGIWEGQILPPVGEILDNIVGNIPSKISKGVKEGAAKAVDIQQWLQQQIGKVIGTR